MDLLATPHQAINRNFLVALGLWPHQAGISKYLLLFNLFFFTISQGSLQIGGMIAAWEAKDVFLESIAPVLVDFVCFSKIINFIANSKRVKDLILTLEEDWRKFKGRKEIEVMNEYAILGRRLTLTYAACLYGSMVPFMILPVVPLLMDVFGFGNETHTKTLMFRVDFLIDAEKYYYPLLIHSYFGTMAYITLCVAIDTMIMIYVQHACSSFAVLGYSKLIEDTNYVSFFFQLGINMVCVSFTGFQTMMHLEIPGVAFGYAAFAIAQTLLLFLQSYPAQMLYDHSTQVSEYAHNCGWYQTSIRTRRLVCLMTMRSRVPCELTAGRFYVLNLANFSSVVRTSMSYLTVLTSTK